MSLREVKYKCTGCAKTNTHKFAQDYKPFRRWWAHCSHCLKHTLQRCLTRGMLTSQNYRGPA